MSAIRPNLNFYNERTEHVPYKNKAELDTKAVYDRLMKADTKERLRPVAIRSAKAYNKWFKED
jgi:hypothetical protein